MTSPSSTPAGPSTPPVLVTGAAGHVGANLVRRLLNDGVRVRVMPWYRALQGRDLRLTSIPRTPIGRALTNGALRVGERLRVVPEGTTVVSTLLNEGADALVEGGRSGIFTPVFFFLARKPQRSGD